jgi:hypothetical protein
MASNRFRTDQQSHRERHINGFTHSHRRIIVWKFVNPYIRKFVNSWPEFLSLRPELTLLGHYPNVAVLTA